MSLGGWGKGCSRLGLRIALGAGIAIFLALATQSWWVAPLIGAHLSKTSGRDVHFDSIRIGLTGSLAPVVVMHGVRIANAPWSDASRPLAVLEELVFQFAWRRFEDRWVISRIMPLVSSVLMAPVSRGHVA